MNLRFLTDRSNYIWYVLLISLAIRIIYVFFCTDYTHYLNNDCGQYLNRAMQSLYGDEKAMNQWTVFPPFYHLYLAEIIKIAKLLGVVKYKLEIIISLNILYSVASIYFLYVISMRLTKNQVLSLIISSSYSLSYVLLYFNAFILSENFAIFAVIFALYLLMRDSRSNWLIFAAGIILALGVATRPAFGLLGLPYFLYLLFENKISKTAILRSALFATGFFLVVILVIAENNHISGGQIKGLAGNGGITFCMARCKAQKAMSYYGPGIHTILPPATVGYPENGVLVTHTPFHVQKYYFKIGLDCIKNDPMSIITDIAYAKNLFYSPLFPSYASAKWFKQLLPVSQHTSLIMFLSLVFTYLLYRDKSIDKKKLSLIVSIPVLCVITLYLFNMEQRYYYSFAFAVHILFFSIIYTMVTKFRDFKKDVIIIIALALFVALSVFTYNIGKKVFIQKNIKAEITANSESIKNIDQKRSAISVKNIFVNSVNFERGNTLKHAVLGELGYKTNYFIDLEANFKVKQEGLYEFAIFSDDGFRLFIDNIFMAEYIGFRPFIVTHKTVYLKRGVHNLKLSYFQERYGSGLKGTYKKIEKNKPHNKFYFIGENSRYIKFLPYK